ncbi:MAG TPA: DUF2510 domain-containing protein [Acidimicrobiales bacterium]|nr:DUF2510 domain-containing protein [Acidimicrobiales bacterium]
MVSPTEGSGEQGWYPVPGEPNYQRYWDGREWTSRRYWGGGGPEAETTRSTVTGSSNVPPPAGGTTRDEDVIETSLNPRTPTAPLAVGCFLAAVFIALMALGILPWQLLFFVLTAGVLVLLFRGRLAAHYWHGRAASPAVGGPVTFASEVWFRFTGGEPRRSAPTDRWVLAVRTDSLQVMKRGSDRREGAREASLRASDCVMWRAPVEGRECIVVSGPSVRRSEAEFAFDARDRAQEAWEALVAAGVHPLHAPTGSTS